MSRVSWGMWHSRESRVSSCMCPSFCMQARICIWYTVIASDTQSSDFCFVSRESRVSNRMTLCQIQYFFFKYKHCVWYVYTVTDAAIDADIDIDTECMCHCVSWRCVRSRYVPLPLCVFKGSFGRCAWESAHVDRFMETSSNTTCACVCEWEKKCMWKKKRECARVDL